MTKIPEYERGFRDGLKAAITGLHQQATTMHEQHARNTWNSAAFWVSCVLRDRKLKLQTRGECDNAINL